jgi:glutaredoxin 3
VEAARMSAPRVVMYSTAWCPYCARARGLFEQKGVAFEEIDIDALPPARADMIRKSGSDTVPQIFIGETHVGGSDELYALESAGSLDSMLTGA